MRRLVGLFVIVSVSLFGVSASAQSDVRLNEPQMAHFISAAEDAEIAAATLALKQSSNETIRNLASVTLQRYSARKKDFSAALGRLKINPDDNDFSRSLADAASQHRQELAKLSGAAFDKAFIENELFYHVAVIGALETALIPSTRNRELKSFFGNCLAAYKEQQKNIQALAKNLK